MNAAFSKDPAASGSVRILAFGVGLLLPLLTLQTAYIGTPRTLADRVLPVDFMCLALLGLLFLFHRFRLPPAGALVYAGTAVLSIVVVCLRFAAPDADFWVAFAAIFMAFCFYLLGLNIGSSPALVRPLLAGVLISVLAESVVVYHDAFVRPQWFPDPMQGRARGTFRASGQLAAFGFCGAGLLITFGWFHARRFAVAFVGAGFIAASFVVLASRRSGMLGILLWALLFLVMGARFHRRGFYTLFAGSLATAALALVALWEPMSQSFVGRRMDEGLGGLNASDGFIRSQWSNAMRTGQEWFPWGYGAGKGLLINRSDIGEHEVHNGLLAVLVELGCAGLAGFLGMVLQPLFGDRARPPLGREALLKVLIGSFIVASVVVMFHNTLYRDRAFLVYVGMASAVALPGIATARRASP